LKETQRSRNSNKVNDQKLCVKTDENKFMSVEKYLKLLKASEKASELLKPATWCFQCGELLNLQVLSFFMLLNYKS
jgi:hypothetical protein